LVYEYPIYHVIGSLEERNDILPSSELCLW